MKYAVSLDRWTQVLRPYQERAVAEGLACAPGASLLLTCPTGTGKGTMQLALLKAARTAGRRAWVVTPSIEVLRGYLERCGARPEDLDGGSQKLARLGERIYVTTPVRMRNYLRGRVVRRGEKRFRVTRKPPALLIVDEAHHSTLETVAGGGLRKLCPDASFVGFTATAYRSTPEETGMLHQSWAERRTLLTIPEAVEQGVWALPTWRVEPLVDDDRLQVVQGDLDADEATITAASPLADLVKTLDLSTPTCVTVSTSRAARELHSELEKHLVPSRLVLSETPTTERSAAYEACRTGGAVLVSVRVLGEGVDLPWLRRWVDASPTLSPVSFLQKLGRITRPHASGKPEYLGTNRNLERHGYLLQGALPRVEVKLAQERFGGGSKRGARVGMLKGVSRLKPVELPLSGGVKGTMWALWCPSVEGGPGFERCVLLDPTSDRALSAVRSIDPTKKGHERFSPWSREESVPEKLLGFRAARLTGTCSSPQLKWWAREAENRGLDAGVAPTKAQFFALPVLKDLKSSMWPDGRPLRPETEDRPRPAVPKPETPSSAVPDGYYTVVERATGAHRTYRVSTQGPEDEFQPGRTILSYLRGPENTSDYERCAFVDGSEVRTWKRYAELADRLKLDLAAILGGPEAAGKLYSLRSGRCYVCGRVLTTPDSIRAGIGPECAGRWSVPRVVREQDPPHEETPRPARSGSGRVALLAATLSDESVERAGSLLTDAFTAAGI